MALNAMLGPPAWHWVPCWPSAWCRLGWLLPGAWPGKELGWLPPGAWLVASWSLAGCLLEPGRAGHSGFGIRIDVK